MPCGIDIVVESAVPLIPFGQHTKTLSRWNTNHVNVGSPIINSLSHSVAIHAHLVIFCIRMAFWFLRTMARIQNSVQISFILHSRLLSETLILSVKLAVS
jgi:hypothetical protein